MGFFTYKVKALLSSLFVAVVFLLAILWGAGKGQALAQSQAVAETAQNLSAGIKYFYQDQNRYPSAVEFADQNIMLNYFTVFPPENLPSKNCPQSYSYQRPSDSNFSLSFCLAAATGSYKAGWNTLTN